MPNPIPGALADWIEIEPARWAVPDHPEYGVITLTPPLTFEQYYAERQLPNQGEILKALPQVAELIDLLATQDGPAIDAWADDNANSLPELRAAFRTLLKVLAARL